MVEKIFIGNFPEGLTQNRLPFFIDNNSFPILYNMYSWRGRAKRKRGTTLLNRLAKQVSDQTGTILLSSGSINLFSQFSITEVGKTITSGSITLVVSGQTYTEPSSRNGTLVGNSGGSGTINYSTGLVTISGGGNLPILVSFSYHPSLPVLGLENFIVPKSTGTYDTASSQYPQLLAFDQKYSYQVNSSSSFYFTGYYKNPASNSDYPGYVPKTIQTTFSWSGQDYQQFWTSNNLGALWASNNNPGFHIQAIKSITRTSATVLNVVVTASPAVVGDFIWINEIEGLTANGTKSINNQAGYVTLISGTLPGDITLTVTFPKSNFLADTYSSGIIQYLTNSVSGRGDGIRWYDGDPTNTTGLPSLSSAGWVNFSPPLGQGSVQIDTINSGANPFYLVGALAIVSFKDRLLFFSPYVTTSFNALNSIPAYQLIDTVIWSWNGTFYYTSSYDGNASLPQYSSILTPGTSTNAVTQGAAAPAYYTNLTGYGGFLSSSLDQQIISVNNNEDVLIVGFTNNQTKLGYTGNDLYPFLFYLTNSELGSFSTFSSVTLDRGAATFGSKGIILSDQTNSQRIDLQIPDLSFQVSKNNHAAERISGERDYFKEWVYFSYVPNNSEWIFPTETFLWNYRDNTWAILYENFTTHGSYRPSASQAFTWLTVPYATWLEWNEPWNSTTGSPLFSNVIAGNPQGYVLIKGLGTGEANSGYVYSIPASGQILSYDHCVKVGDYLYFSNFTGTDNPNNQIGMVTQVIDRNNFIVDLSFSGTGYVGNGTFARLSQPLLQTKQFPSFWEQGRQVRLGTQQYLMDSTDEGQVTLNIYLSQNPFDILNLNPILPSLNTSNNSLVYSQIINTNVEVDSLQTPNPPASSSFQIWHRMNTSLIGSTFQIGLTLSDAQMRNYSQATSEIGLHAAVLDIYPGPLLA